MREIINGNSLTLGTCYYPEHWDRSLWREDLDRMLEAGIRVIRIAEFAWNKIEPREGEYTYEFFDSFLDVVEETPMKVIFCTPTATPPAWLAEEYPEILNVLCGAESAYCQRGSVSQEFFDLTGIYYHRLKWVDDLKSVNDRILKFAPTVPEEKTYYYYYEIFRERLRGRVEPVTSGHGSVDLIMPGCHKASGIQRLAERWGITPEQCAAFGDGGNDVEMLKYCGHSYAMENASPEAKKRQNTYVLPMKKMECLLLWKSSPVE